LEKSIVTAAFTAGAIESAVKPSNPRSTFRMSTPPTDEQWFGRCARTTRSDNGQILFNSTCVILRLD